MIGERIRRQREESLGNSQGLGKGMLWHGNPSLLVMLCGSLSGSKALEPGHLLPGTGCSQDLRNQPVTDSIAWNQPNTVGKMRCYTEDAAVFMPSLSYYSCSSTPNVFLLCQRKNKHHPCLSLISCACILEENHVDCLFVCHLNNWKSQAQLHPWKSPSQWLSTAY